MMKETENNLKKRIVELEKENAKLKNLIEKSSLPCDTKFFPEILEPNSFSENQFAEIFNQIPFTFFVVNTEGIILSINRYGLEKSSCVSGEIVGTNLFNQTYEEDRANVIETFNSFLKSKRGIVNWQARKVHKTRGLIWVQATARFIPEDKNPEKIFIICEDITERKLAEIELRKSDKKLSNVYRIVNDSPVTVFIWKNNEGWPIEYISENVVELTGYSQDDFISGSVSYLDIIHADDIERVSSEVSTASSNENSDRILHKPYRIVDKNGQVKWIEDSTRIIRDDNRNIICNYSAIKLQQK